MDCHRRRLDCLGHGHSQRHSQQGHFYTHGDFIVNADTHIHSLSDSHRIRYRHGNNGPTYGDQHHRPTNLHADSDTSLAHSDADAGGNGFAKAVRPTGPEAIAESQRYRA